MKITALKAQVKNPERVSVFIDNVYSVSLTASQLLTEKLHVGMELDQSRLDSLRQASDYGKLYERLLQFALMRPHSKREVLDYIRRKQFDPALAQPIVERLVDRHYIDDLAFAKAWVESRQLHKAISQRRLKLELQKKGVADTIINSVIDESSYDERTALQTLVAKKRRLSRYRDVQKLRQYLLGQGFSYEVIKDALATDETTDEQFYS
jgi:regulatory protein